MAKQTGKKTTEKDKMNKKASNNKKPGDGVKKKPVKYSAKDQIGKSKQLKEKLRNRSVCNRSRRENCKNNNASIIIDTENSKVRVNEVVMPPLEELERMFDDSDDDENDTVPKKANGPQEIVPKPSTPVSSVTPIEEIVKMSPTTFKTIANKVLNILNNLSDQPILIATGPPPPVIPPKKRKKTEVPHIVGCKERAQVEWNPKSSFCKGDEKYGVESHSDNSSNEDLDRPQHRKRSKTSSKIKPTSIFNAKSDEIAAILRDRESSYDSSSSNSTLPYVLPENQSSVGYNFTPLPSTSTDTDVFLENEKLLNESLSKEVIYKDDLEIQNDFSNSFPEKQEPEECIPKEELSNDSPNCDVQIIEQPSETIVICDQITPHKPLKIDSPINLLDESEVEIVENKVTRPESPIIIDDYSNLDFNVIYDAYDDDCEIIDVENVIAESDAVLKKYQTITDLDTITSVDCSSQYASQPNVTQNNRNPAGENGNGNSFKTTTNEINIDSCSNLKVPVPSTHQPSHAVSINISMDTSHDKSIEIVNTVTNFFNNSSSIETIDLSDIPIEREERWTDKIMNWVHSLNSAYRNSNINRVQNSQVMAPVNINTNHRAPVNTQPAAQGRGVMYPFSRPGCSMEPTSTTTLTTPSRRSKQNRPGSFPKRPPIQPAPQTTQIATAATVPVAAPTAAVSPAATRNLGDCPICIENLSAGPVASTICGHVFCMACIKAAIKANGKKCPSCRKPLKGIGYHQLYL